MKCAILIVDGVEDPDNYEFLCDSCQTIYSTQHNNSNENNDTPIGQLVINKKPTPNSRTI